MPVLGKERESGVGKLGWHGNFDTEFERNTFFRSKSRMGNRLFSFYREALVLVFVNLIRKTELL